MGDFLFGSSGTDPKPFRAPGWKQQGNLLNQFGIGQVLGLFPQLGNQFSSNASNLEKQIAQLQSQMSGGGGQFGGGGSSYNYRTGTGSQDYGNQNDANLNAQLAKLQGQLTQQQQLSGLAQNNPFADYMQTPDYNGLNDVQALQFQERNPYDFSFSFDPNQALQDAYTPQMDALTSLVSNRGQEERTAITDDYNRRGLGTAGASSQAITRQLRDQEDRLANASASLGAQQANSRMNAYQFQSNLEAQRQMQQAAEIFRQQGASDEQAMQLAQDSMNRRNQGFNERQTMFQNKQGLRQQTFDDLLKMFGYSTGATPGTEGSPGLIQSIAPAAGAAGIGALAGGLGGMGAGAGALLGLMCLPKGTKIETESGSSNVEDIKPGDIVKGGMVLSISSTKRTNDHKFFKHVFKTGEVVMSKGHPYFDELLSLSVTENDSPNTYDILTDSGHYYVNGVKLGSTIGGNYGSK